MTSLMPSVAVRLPNSGEERGYPIYIAPNTLLDSELVIELIGNRSVCLVTNDAIAPLYLARVMETLGGKRKITVVTLSDGEVHKTLHSYQEVLTAALDNNHERSTVFIALGGGVVGDITGFAAATFLRGVEFIQMPTTLLSQVDSSVGGKTGINHPMGKNLIGAFHQPLAVLIDTNTLSTLPDREFAAGMAEVIKYGLIADARFFSFLMENAEGLKGRDEDLLRQVITRCCEIKADVVNRDERESGVRAILNFGHTFGHAIEKDQGFGAWLHGEAVSAGMVLATRISVARGAVSVDVLAELIRFLEIFGLPTQPPENMALAIFLNAMQGDKKVKSGQIRYVLLASLGSAVITADVTEGEIEACLKVRT